VCILICTAIELNRAKKRTLLSLIVLLEKNL
jgi:hypothetical protein